MNNAFHYIILIIGILSVQIAFAGGKTVWHSKNTVTIESFKGSPQEESPYSAKSYCNIEYNAKVKKGVLMVEVIAEFDNKRSWLIEDEFSRKVVAHENGHFNLVEIYARKFRKAVSEATFTKENYEAKLAKLSKEMDKKLQIIQASYDGQSDHGVNTFQQIEWNKRIAAQLRMTEELAPTLITKELSN